MKLLILSLCAIAFGAPAGATVINISGTQNGEQGGNGVCRPVDSPCVNGALIDPVQVTFGPGTYTVFDAYNPVSGYAPGALYDAWNFEAGNAVGWVWNYNVFYDDDAQGATINPENYYTYLLLNVNATTDDRRSTEESAAAVGVATPTSTFTLGKTTTLDFVVNDYYLPDNAGGISLDIEQVEAASPCRSLPPGPCLVGGFGLLGGAIRRNRANIKFA